MNNKTLILIISFILASFFSLECFAQSEKFNDVVYLKDGSVIHGIIIEQIPNISLKIETKNRSVFVYQLSEILKITKNGNQKPEASINLKSQTSKKSSQSDSRVKFGLKVGLNLANVAQNFKESEYESNTDILLGLSFGATVEYQLKENLVIQSGLLISRNGNKSDYKDEWGSSENKIKVTWLEIPINFTYKLNNFQIYAGPYMAFGLSGKYESNDSRNGETESYSTDLNFGNSEGDNSRGLDYGLNFGLGYQMKNLLFNTGYSLGLANLTPNDSNGDWKISNRVISFSVSYFFGK